ncbi:RidA family protein [Microbacterium sp. No. 7]|uniref:RidA family protein n=1 Tax=Microbacterium sp. No. 7 TaxID=1714373 RepID=UPI0006CFAF03|nr:Rid family hydrolase [Microbacterium sp. No. 7]ALJ21404.1 enamine deaminase RidA [Microbacterium sp. No. 7]
MSGRVSVELPGFGHANPIPAASRIGPFVYSSAFTGRESRSGEVPPDLDRQVVNIFEHVRSLMAAVDGTVDDIIKMTFWLVDFRDRTALNREWLAMFPDPSSRPARHAVHAQLDNGLLVQADLTAIVDLPRQ